MPNLVNQNPRNKAGRNSGAGPGGVTAWTPSRAEAQQGLRRYQMDAPSTWPIRIGLAVGVLALLGSGVMALALRRAERKRSVRGRLESIVNWR